LFKKKKNVVLKKKCKNTHTQYTWFIMADFTGDEMVASRDARLEKENEALKEKVEALEAQVPKQKSSAWDMFSRLTKGQKDSTMNNALKKSHKIKDDKKDITEFLELAKLGESSQIEKLIEKGVPVDAVANWEDGFQETALMVAAKWGQTHTVEVLIANRADIDKRDEVSLYFIQVDVKLNYMLLQNGETALYKATEFGRKETVKALVHRGSRLNGPTNRIKKTPLMSAATIGHTDIAVFLIEEGAQHKLVNSVRSLLLSVEIFIDCSL